MGYLGCQPANAEFTVIYIALAFPSEPDVRNSSYFTVPWAFLLSILSQFWPRAFQGVFVASLASPSQTPLFPKLGGRSRPL